VRRAWDLFNFTITSVYAGKRRYGLFSLTGTRIHHDVITDCRGGGGGAPSLLVLPRRAAATPLFLVVGGGGGGGGGPPMLLCPRPIFSLGIKSDLKTSTGHNC